MKYFLLFFSLIPSVYSKTPSLLIPQKASLSDLVFLAPTEAPIVLPSACIDLGKKIISQNHVLLQDIRAMNDKDIQSVKDNDSLRNQLLNIMVNQQQFASECAVLNSPKSADPEKCSATTFKSLNLNTLVEATNSEDKATLLKLLELSAINTIAFMNDCLGINESSPFLFS